MHISNRRIRTAFASVVVSIVVTACGGEGGSDGGGQQSVTRTNTAPTISGTPPTTATVGQPYSFAPAGSDIDGDTLTYAADGVPAWAALNAATGQLSGVPTAPGTFANIIIRVSDGQVTTALQAFSITASAAALTNNPPTISGSPATTATVGVAYSFRPTASDPDGDALTFSISNRPTWATFSATNGMLSGTPTTTGAYNNIVVSVSDGKVSRPLPAFGITVSAAMSTNTPPTLTGAPLTTVLQNRTYSFTPVASDANGDPLTFSASNLPIWATFDATTGRLSGTPTVGAYAGITITVSDGKANTSLAPFTITVVATASGSASLSWQAPTQNTDGSALTDLAGFTLYWGTAPGSYTDSVKLTGTGTMTYVVTNLTPATWYFTATALNSANVESARSTEASKVIQ